MSNKVLRCLLACLIAAPLPAVGQGPDASPSRPDNTRSRAHIEKARALAGDDLRATFDFFCVPGVARGQDNDAPALEPVRLFDNLYAIGNSETTVYVITTSEGLILLDSGFAGQAETVLVPGLKKLGLDPADVKYVLLGHAHADHFGGSKYFQDRYGARVGLAGPDWDALDRQAAGRSPSAPQPPRRDFVVVDRQPVTLGDLSVTPVLIPGHTPGSLAYIFPVREGATTRMAGLFGGTLLSSFLRAEIPAVQQYIASVNRYLDVATQMNVEVEIQNHPIFDDMPAKLARLRTRKAGEPHPFVIGSDGYTRFWTIVTECMQAELARRDK
jgi:metallo-beta-lactamase class B